VETLRHDHAALVEATEKLMADRDQLRRHEAQLLTDDTLLLLLTRNSLSEQQAAVLHARRTSGTPPGTEPREVNDRGSVTSVGLRRYLSDSRLIVPDYLEDVLRKLADAAQHHPADVELGSEYLLDLLPDRWAAAHPQSVRQERIEEQQQIGENKRVRRARQRILERQGNAAQR
jgi:hypothetical protein